jgi:hypothetical protein
VEFTGFRGQRSLWSSPSRGETFARWAATIHPRLRHREQSIGRSSIPGKTWPSGRPSYYEFAGITMMEYAGDGQFSFHEDVYNWEEVVPVLKEWAGAQRRG